MKNERQRRAYQQLIGRSRIYAKHNSGAKKYNSYYLVGGAWDLQGIKNKNVVQHLIKALNDTDPDVRVTAATVLGWMREGKAVEPLIKILKDNVDEVRLAAIEALGEIGDGKAADPLVMRFENEDVGAATWVAALKSLTEIYLKYSSNKL